MAISTYFIFELIIVTSVQHQEITVQTVSEINKNCRFFYYKAPALNIIYSVYVAENFQWK